MENYRNGTDIIQTSLSLQLYFTRKITCLGIHKILFLFNLKLPSLELENTTDILFSNNVFIKYKGMLLAVTHIIICSEMQC